MNLRRVFSVLLCVALALCAVPAFAVQPLTYNKYELDVKFSLKAPLESPTFTGTPTAPEWASNAPDNTHAINVGNTSDPASAVDGECQYNKTLGVWRCFNGVSWVTQGGSGGGITIVFYDGFESNSLSEWTNEVDAGNNLTVSSTVAYGGSTYSLKAVKADNDNNYYVRRDVGYNYPELWYHFRIYWNEISSAAPTAAGWYAIVKNSDASANSVWITAQVDSASPRLMRRIAVWYRNAAGTMVNLNGSNSYPSAATWYEVKVRIKKSTTDASGDGIVQAWFGGTQVVNSSGLNMHATFTMQYPHLGLMYMDSLGSWPTLIQYVDNFQIAGSDIW